MILIDYSILLYANSKFGKLLYKFHLETFIDNNNNDKYIYSILIYSIID